MFSMLSQILISPLQWFRRASLALRLAVLIGVFQVAIVLFATIAVFALGEFAVLQLWWSPGKILTLFALFIAVPVLVHRATLLWCEHSPTRWSDITVAWSAAVSDLKRHGIDPEEWPIFLVLGTNGDARESALLNTSGAPLLVSGSPGRGTTLHVYASADAIYVCLNSIGQLGAAAAARRGMGDAQGIAKSLQDEVSRLDAFCDLLLRERAPYVPCNGFLVVLPLDLEHRSSKAISALGDALAADLHRLTRRLHVRAPAVFLGTGLEHEAGVTEFFEILASKQQPQVNADKTVSKPTGRESARGGMFPVGIQPTPAHLAAVAAHAVGPLTDEIAELLLDPDSQAEQWTRIRLLKMLCRLRLYGAVQLDEMLGKVFAAELSEDYMPLLAGAFTGSLSEDQDRQGFLRGVLSFQVDQQAELEWNRPRVEADTRARSASRVLFASALFLLVAAVGMLWWRLFA